MRLFVNLFFTLLCFSALSQTQMDINENANSTYKNADKELNIVYQKILSDYKSDLEFIKNLKASQRNWIKFRDSELNMKYPEREFGYYGSIHSTCVSQYLEQLTKDRVRTLKIWLKDAEQGDPCSGSVKIRD